MDIGGQRLACCPQPVGGETAEIAEVLGEIATLQEAYEQDVLRTATAERTMADAVFLLTRLAITQSRAVAVRLDRAAVLLGGMGG